MSPGELKLRAESYYQVCNLTLASGQRNLLQNALENIHLAVELAMKSVIARNEGKYPNRGWEGHNLETLISVKYKNGRSLARDAKEIGATVLSVGLSAWSMNCRYKIMNDYPSMEDTISAYKELYLWIKTNFL
jgi:HEPN domain-containing protein